MEKWIGWFARNGVAANLLMVFIMVMGIVAITTVPMEVFPEISLETVSITVPYLGAAPEEVEEGVCVRVEEAIQDIQGIKKLRSTASEGIGSVLVELDNDVELSDVLDKIKARVDAIETFPEETEKPIVQEMLIRRQVISIAIFGPTSEKTLKHVAERVRDDLNAKPGITQVDLAAARPYEISIEVSEETLRRHGLTFDDVVRAVQSSSLDMPGGAVRAESGEILLRTKGQAYNAQEYNDLILRAWPNGMRLRLGDVATVVDGFAETDQSSRFDAYPTVLVQVFRVGDQTAIGISDAVKDYVSEIAPTLPEGLQITTWQDDSRILQDRMDVLIRNGRMGLLLVFLVLALFLKLRLAMWVSVGIAVSFLGAFAVMPLMGITINLMSLFAFIMVLGIVVDDAIVVGENIYRHFEMGKSGLRAGIDGAREVGVPVTFSILTTLAAFYPLMNISGGPGQFLRQIPAIVIACLIFSLIESLFVLPNHLSHMEHHEDRRGSIARGWDRFQGRFTGAMTWLIDTLYRPTLDRVLRYRYATLSAAIGLLIVSSGLVAGGWIKFVFFPEVEADAAVALLTMPQGTSAETTEAAIRQLEVAAIELKKQLENEGNDGVFTHMLASVGSQPFAEMSRQNGPGMGAAATVTSAAHLGELTIELSPSQDRDISSTEIARRWRELSPTIPDAVDLTFSASLISFGSPIDLQLQSLDIDELRSAAADIKAALRNYPGVSEVSDSYRAGKREIKLDIHPRAEALGLSLADLASQVRQGFYGAEAQRIQRGRDDIRVMVRYPAEERGTLASLEQMRIRTPTGAEVPFAFAGDADFGRGFAAIQRTDRQRTMNVTADVDPAISNANEIIADLEASFMPDVLARHPRVSYSLSGEQEFQAEALGDMMRAFLIAMIMIFGLLAIPFRSYLQPIIVMSAIPFGLIGAVFGHLVLGLELTMLSIFGIIALTGVVVNDSLVMVDFINRAYRGGMPLEQALREAGEARFRPIVLTSMTTFVGLTPLLLEKSIQAQFLIPMAVSLAFGVLFATAITLLLVPTLYRILEDLKPKRSRSHDSIDNYVDLRAPA